MNGDFSRFDPQQHKTAEGARQTNSRAQREDRFSQAFNVLLNYWEIKPTQYEAKLHELALKDVRTVAAFVPWAHVETDIYHSLKKFVRAAYAVKLNVRLFVMPELGVNYPNAGIPKDLLSNISNLAVDRVGRVIYNYGAPNIFALPSFSSPEVLKRFGNYLIKISTVLGEIFSEVGTSSFCEIVVTNSLFNYYRSSGMRPNEHGDYSAAQVMAFRDFLDREYPAPVASTSGAESYVSHEQFKMQVYESYNRHRFFTHIERLLREKTDMVFARKNTSCAVRHIDLFDPECASEAGYQGLLTELFEFRPSVERFYQSLVLGGHRGEAIYLGNSGVFRRFADQEKSFLMLAALIHSGEVGVIGEELFKLRPNFQRKLRSLLTFLDERKFVRHTRVTYVSASKFAMEEHSFNRLAAMAPGVLSVTPGLDGHSRQHLVKNLSERLVFMDPKSVMRLMELVQLLSLAQSGRVVAIPMPMSSVPNYAPDAMVHFEKFRKGRQPLRLNIGLAYEVFEYHLGHVVFYDPQIFWTDGDKSNLALFFQALLGLADVKPLCRVNNKSVNVVSYLSEEDPSQRLVFLINPTGETLDVQLSFDDTVALSGMPNGGERSEPIIGKLFELQIPFHGVLSMQLSDVSQTEIDSRTSGASPTSGQEGVWS